VQENMTAMTKFGGS